ncbi:MAG: response regulator [Candidatus Moranbacteria bacterium]|nr:response regulator [Candidatus Moranbacteria bacterium]
MSEKQPKVLLVEDDSFISEIYGTKFELEGIDIEIAEDGEEAVKKFKEIKPKIVLLDIFLPKKDGWEVLREIKQIDGFADCKVIMLTNLGDKDKVEEAKEAGVDDYFVKASYTPEEVVKKVRENL